MDTENEGTEERKAPCVAVVAPTPAASKKTFRRFKFAKPSLSQAVNEKEKDPESVNNESRLDTQRNTDTLESTREQETDSPPDSKEKIKIISDINVNVISQEDTSEREIEEQRDVSRRVFINKARNISGTGSGPTTAVRRLRFIKPKPSLSTSKESERDDSSSEGDAGAIASTSTSAGGISTAKQEKPSEQEETDTRQNIIKKEPEVSDDDCDKNDKIHAAAPQFQQNDELPAPAPAPTSTGECTLDETKISTYNLHTNTSTSTPDNILTMPDSPVKRVLPAVFECSSPSKIKRAMLKTIPHLDQRRPSCSASESEDESRKTSRQRTDSVCSMMSNTSATSPTKSVVKAEQSRKLADAKREFNMKFANANPAKNKLTMIDLIFYNPPTNPMIRAEKKTSGGAAEKQLQAASASGIESLIDEDDPDRSDEENEDLPAPQVIIGPDGNLIIDDKSLVVENKKLRKQREKLHRSAVIDGDNRDTYGVYKRAKRSKEWDDVETIRFYSALNSIGTDFSTMCELFPQRTRRELKMKFKKEERVNGSLVDRALMQPCHFNFELLLQESMLEEKEREVREECERVALEKKKKLMDEKRKAREAKRLMKEEEKKKQREEIASQIENDGELSERGPWWKRRSRSGLKRKRSSKPRVLDISRVLEETDSENDDVFNDESDASDDDSSQYEGALIERPTRSGRIPKKRQLFEPIQETCQRKKADRESEREEPCEPVPVSTGDLVIVSSDNVEGEKGYDLVMMTQEDDQSAVVVKMEGESEIGSSRGVLKITATTVTELMEEHNYTIVEGDSSNAGAGAATVGASDEGGKTS